MIVVYRFGITDTRRMQWTNRLCLESPYIHATRNLDVHDFIYLVRGEWEIGLGKETYLMKPGDVLLLPANITHRGVAPCTPNTEIIYLHIYPEECDGKDETVSDETEYVLINNFINTGELPHIKLLFQRLLQLKNSPKIAGVYINTLLYELSIISQSRDEETLARKIRDYLIHSEERKTNKEIAEHFYLSQKTVENVFKQEYKMPMHQYVIRQKLECAKQYLKDYPNITLYEIARILNFCDEHHLSRMFKKTFGITPREYKKETNK